MKALDRSLHCLSRPPAVIAVSLLLLNDHFLKAAFPGWWTGKLSDVAGLFFFPFVVSALLALILDRMNVPPRLTAASAFWLVGGWFAAMKTIPLANEVTVSVWQHLAGGPVAIVPDPTDLLALLLLWPAWRLWQRSAQGAPTPSRSPGWQEWFLLSVASAASLATSCIEPPAVYDVFADAEELYAVVTAEGYGAVYQFLAADNRWAPVNIEPPPLAEAPQAQESCLVAGPCYRITQDEEVWRSPDGGGTWRVAWTVPAGRRKVMERYHYALCDFFDMGPYDVAIAGSADKHRVVVASGLEGVLLRHPDGTWERQAVAGAEPTPYTITSPSRILRALSSEIALLAAGTMALMSAFYAVIWRSALAFLFGAVLGPLALGFVIYAQVSDSAALFPLFAAIVNVLLGFHLAWRWMENESTVPPEQRLPALRWWLVATLAIPAGSLFMFLWPLGVIARYETAAGLWLAASLVLASISMVKSRRIMRSEHVPAE